MSEYLAGLQDNGAGNAGPESWSGRHIGHVSHVDNFRSIDGEHEHMHFGIPFSGVLPIWHDDATIIQYRPADGTDLSTVLGMGPVESEPGPAQVPAEWQERVETGILADAGRLPLLKVTAPSGRRAINDPGEGAPISPEAPLSYTKATGGVLDIVGFGICIGRVMLRTTCDDGIALLTLRAPHGPEPHHILFVSAEADDHGVMSFHLGVLRKMKGGVWDSTTHRDGMALLDLTTPYSDLVTGAGPNDEEGLDADSILEMARPIVQCIFKPGYPFVLGASILLP